MKKSIAVLIPLTAWLATIIASPIVLEAQTFTKVADFSTAIPNGSGSFTDFYFSPPVISGGYLAFHGIGSAGQSGLYLWNGTTLSRIADLSTTIPNGTGNFTDPSFGTYSISNNAVSFVAGGSSSQAGIYRSADGTLTRVVDTSFNLPGTSTKFQTLDGPWESGGVIAFAGSGNQWVDHNGLFTITGNTVTKIADNSTVLPGAAETFSSTFKVINSNGVLAFHAITSGGNEGVYVWSGSSFTRIAFKNVTIMPGLNKAMTGFLDQMDLDSGNIIFSAVSDVGGGYDQGIYSATTAGASLTRLVDTSMTIPGTSTVFANLEGFKMIGTTLVFAGSDDSYENGVFTAVSGTITKILGPGDSLSGKTVQYATCSWQGYTAGNVVALLVGFTDNTQGIYTTTISSNTATPPTLSSPTITVNGFKVTLTLTAGNTYRLQATSAVADPNSWATLTTINNAPASTTYTDTDSGNYTRRFYRLISP